MEMINMNNEISRLARDLRDAEQKWNPTAIKLRQDELEKICRNNARCSNCRDSANVEYEISWDKSKWYDDGCCYFKCLDCGKEWSEG